MGGVKFVGKVLEDLPPKELKPMTDELKKQIGSGVVAVVSTCEGKVSLVVGVTEDLIAKVSAVDLVKVGAATVGGKGGGGRPDMAQAGGSEASQAPAALIAMERELLAKIAG